MTVYGYILRKIICIGNLLEELLLPTAFSTIVGATSFVYIPLYFFL